MAMAHWRLGHEEVARRWYDKAAQWMKDFERALDNQPLTRSELYSLRTEAAELLSVANRPKTIRKDKRSKDP